MKNTTQVCSACPCSCLFVMLMMLYLIECHGSRFSRLATVSLFLSFIRSPRCPQPKWLLDRLQRGPTSTSIHPHTFLIRSQSGAKMMPGTAHPTRRRPQIPSPSGVVRTTSPRILGRRARLPRPRRRRRPFPSRANRETALARPSPCRTHTSACRAPQALHTPPTRTRSRFLPPRLRLRRPRP